MENEKQFNNKKKTAILVVGIVIILAVIIAVALSAPKDEKNLNKEKQTPGQNQVDTPNGEGADMPVEGTEGVEATDAVEAELGNPILVGAVAQAPGADLITTEGKVVNQSGEEVKTDVAYNSPEAPAQTMAISEEDVAEAIKLKLDSNGFTPNSFTVSAGQAITIALTGTDETSHVFAFENPVLGAVFINIRPGETRAVTFPAPKEAGEYLFFCDFPGHRGRGEQGTMIVK